MLRGGTEGDYHASLREGGEVISHIFENLSDRWKVLDIFVDRGGVWHLSGIKAEPADLVNNIDVVWNTAEPRFGNILQNLSIPTINISSFSSLLRENHEMLREHIEELGLQMPKKIVLPSYQEDFDGEAHLYAAKKAKEIWQKFPAPWIVKSFTEDNTMAKDYRHAAKTFPDLVDAILDGVHHNKSILVEELISGADVSGHSVAGFRDQGVYVFPFEGVNREHKRKLEDVLRDLHHHLGATHYLHSDFTIHPEKGIFITDVSFSPDLKQGSHFHQVCESIGAKMHHVIEHMLEKSLR